MKIKYLKDNNVTIGTSNLNATGAIGSGAIGNILIP
jgi:hypothetical protein